MALQTQTFSTGDYGFQSWSNSYVLSLTLTEDSVDVGANTSQISYLLTLSNTDNNRFYDYYYSWDISIGGQVIPIRDFYFDLRTNYTTQTIASGQLTVSHNPNGTLAMPYSVSIPNVRTSNTYGPPAMALSGEWALTTIPRASKVSCTSAEIGANPTITIQSASADFTHTLSYWFGNLRGTIVENTTSGQYTGWTVPSTFYSQIPNASAGIGMIICKTYYAGVLVGETSCDLVAAVNAEQNKPTLSPSITDTAHTWHTGDDQILIRYFSDAEVVVNAVAKNGATIQKVEVRNGDRVLTGDGTFTGVENPLFSFTVTDSRGFVATHTVDKSETGKWIPYIPFTCDVADTKPSVNGEFAVQVSGNYFDGAFGARNNNMNVWYRIKTQNGAYADWVKIPHTITGNTYSVTVNLTDLDYHSAYVIQVKAGDTCKEILTAEKIVKALPVFDWGENDFNVNGTFKIGGTALDYILAQGTSGIWTYRIWESGVAECWGRQDFRSIAITQAVGSFYKSTSEIQPDLPSAFTFTQMPYCHATVRDVIAQNPVFVSCFSGCTSSKTQAFYLYSPTAQTVAVNLSFYAVGRWK